jgi:hypothetical protein
MGIASLYPSCKPLLAGRQLDRDVAGGAYHAPALVGVAVALDRFQEQNKFLGKYVRRLNE